MPHLIVEYSANLDDQIDIQKLIEAVHQAALRTGVFEVAAVRTRAERRDYYVIADGHEDNAFVAISVGWRRAVPAKHGKGWGRKYSMRPANLEKVYERTPLAISPEVQEIDNTAAFRKNNLHAIVKERAV